MSAEFEQLDIMQNIEASIVSIYRDFPELTDYEVETAYSALIKTNRKQENVGAPTKPSGELALLIYDRTAGSLTGEWGDKLFTRGRKSCADS